MTLAAKISQEFLRLGTQMSFILFLVNDKKNFKMSLMSFTNVVYVI